jgi:hypothetical protein
MFTWVCPTCGREYDVATTECPNCANLPGPKRVRVAEGGPGRRFWLLLGAGTAAAIAVIALLAYIRSRPAAAPEKSRVELQRPAGASFQEPPRQIEVAGIRTFYDAGGKPQVRAVVVNHSEEGLRDLSLTVTLRPVQSAAGSAPLARFNVRISGEIKSGASREIQAPLEAFGTLASLPPWHQLRADLE